MIFTYLSHKWRGRNAGWFGRIFSILFTAEISQNLAWNFLLQIRVTGTYLSLFFKVFGRTASPILDSFVIPSLYYYYIGSTRLKAEKSHSNSTAAVFNHNHPDLWRDQVCHKNWKNLELYTQKKLQQFFQQHFSSAGRRLRFGIFALFIGLYWGRGGKVFSFKFLCLISIYTRWEFRV